MRSRSSVPSVVALYAGLFAAAAALPGCGDYSTEDLRFLAALPTRDELVVAVPAQAATGGVAAAAACAGPTAETWGWAKPTSDDLNAMVDLLTGLVDVVRRVPPTSREADARTWGPFDDDHHPGKEIQVRLVRSFPPELAGAPAYGYAFQARPRGTSAWTTVLEGSFAGASATRGRGGLALHFDLLRALDMADPDAPAGTLSASYDRTVEPRRVSIDVAQPGSGLLGFVYAYAGYADGRGQFKYTFRDGAGNRAEVSAGFDGAGRGRAVTTWFPAGGGQGGFEQCWDASACLTWVADPFNLSCGAAPCSFGTDAACAPVPAPLP